LNYNNLNNPNNLNNLNNLKKNIENNKNFNEHKNINININNINTLPKNETFTNQGKIIQFSSPRSTNTSNILINTSNVNNNFFNKTNNINININNNYSNNSNNIININNICGGLSSNNNNINPLSLNNNLFDNNINNISHDNFFSNNNFIGNNNNINNNFSGFNQQLFQSLASVDYKDNNSDKKKLKKKFKEIRIKHKRLSKEGSYNCGRWQPEEHERFIEAIMKFGNEWKQVQKYVGTRSSTQARSHAQKFFVKIKRANILDFNIDLSKNSMKNLHEMANNLNSDEYVNAIKALNCVAFERKTNSSKRKNKKDDQNLYDSNLNLSEESDTKINLM